MKKFLCAACAFVLAMTCVSASEARYRFDDLYGPSGVGAQWMIITGGNETLGDTAKRPIIASADITNARNSVVLTNGRSTEPITLDDNRDIHTMFLVLTNSSDIPGGYADDGTPQANMTVDFFVPATQIDTDDPQREAVTSDTYLDPRSEFYSSRKTPHNVPPQTPEYSSYDFLIYKDKEEDIYGSKRTNFIYHENPSGAYPSIPSQTLVVPFVIANVYNGTAQHEPLRLRTTLRNTLSSTRGDIVAYDDFRWRITQDDPNDSIEKGEMQWVLVPVDTWPINDDRIYYGLTAEVTNHTAIRYTCQRYDSYAWYNNIPSYWKFDLPRTPDTGDLLNPFQLDELSHIAPGLTTVYQQRFNINQGMKTALRLYPVDPASGFSSLVLNHRVIFGVDLGSAESDAGATTRATFYKVQAFDPRAASTSFLPNVAAAMREKGVKVPDGHVLTQGSVKDEYVAGDMITSFALDTNIPRALQSEDQLGLLPVHVTINLPRTHLYVSRYWDYLLNEWYENGDIHDAFANHFSIYFIPRRDGKLEMSRPWNMIEELRRRGTDGNNRDYYNDQVKLFVDESRGVITISFIAMMMDGTRDGVRPVMDFVEDTTNVTKNNFMIIRDGWMDNKWSMTFCVAQDSYFENNSPRPTYAPKDGSGGGGCSTGFASAALATAALFALRKARQNDE